MLHVGVFTVVPPISASVVPTTAMESSSFTAVFPKEAASVPSSLHPCVSCPSRSSPPGVGARIVSVFTVGDGRLLLLPLCTSSPGVEHGLRSPSSSPACPSLTGVPPPTRDRGRILNGLIDGVALPQERLRSLVCSLVVEMGTFTELLELRDPFDPARPRFISRDWTLCRAAFNIRPFWTTLNAAALMPALGPSPNRRFTVSPLPSIAEGNGPVIPTRLPRRERGPTTPRLPRLHAGPNAVVGGLLSSMGEEWNSVSLFPCVAFPSPSPPVPSSGDSSGKMKKNG